MANLSNSTSSSPSPSSSSSSSSIVTIHTVLDELLTQFYSFTHGVLVNSTLNIPVFDSDTNPYLWKKTRLESKFVENAQLTFHMCLLCSFLCDQYLFVIQTHLPYATLPGKDYSLTHTDYQDVIDKFFKSEMSKVAMYKIQEISLQEMIQAMINVANQHIMKRYPNGFHGNLKEWWDLVILHLQTLANVGSSGTSEKINLTPFAYVKYLSNRRKKFPVSTLESFQMYLKHMKKDEVAPSSAASTLQEVSKYFPKSYSQ